MGNRQPRPWIVSDELWSPIEPLRRNQVRRRLRADRLHVLTGRADGASGRGPGAPSRQRDVSGARAGAGKPHPCPTAPARWSCTTHTAVTPPCPYFHVPRRHRVWSYEGSADYAVMNRATPVSKSESMESRCAAAVTSRSYSCPAAACADLVGDRHGAGGQRVRVIRELGKGFCHTVSDRNNLRPPANTAAPGETGALIAG
jgi:hypothetical protein